MDVNNVHTSTIIIFSSAIELIVCKQCTQT